MFWTPTVIEDPENATMRPESIAIGLPLFIVIATITFLVMRNLVRLWLDHRVKMALLEKFETHPELLPGLRELQEVLDGPARQQEERRRLHYVWTGIFLALVGVGCALFAHAWLSGRYATGLYFGGLACVLLGFLLTLLGLAMRHLSRTAFPNATAAGKPR